MSSPDADKADEQKDELTPEDIIKSTYEDTDNGGSVFVQAFTPKTRALILDAVVHKRGDALTAQEIANQHSDLSVASFNRHRDALVATGLLVERGKKGNAMTYSLNANHPAAQLLAMLDNIFLWGETPMMLDDQFINDADSPQAIDNVEWETCTDK